MSTAAIIPREGSIVTCCFAIFPDGSPTPVAVFESLEDALEWGMQKYRAAFSIRHITVAEAPPALETPPDAAAN